MMWKLNIRQIVTMVSVSCASPALAADLSVILSECAACHGADGVGRDVEIPNLAGQQERYLYLQLQNFKSGRRPHKEMRYESRHLTDEEMRDVSHYYAQLPAAR